MELTAQEERLVQRIIVAGKWDHLWWELSYLVPCIVIVALGIWNNAIVVAATGLLVFLIFHGRSALHQASQFPVFKGLCEKIDGATDANSTADGIRRSRAGALAPDT